MNIKFCRDCGDYRPASDFTKNARSRDGLAFYCREHWAGRSLKSREARRRQAVAAELAAARNGLVAASRPGEPPVGSQRRPGSQRTTGRKSGARRREVARGADG